MGDPRKQCLFGRYQIVVNVYMGIFELWPH
jgi:hypothetical protein